MNNKTPEQIHAECIVIDAVCPLVMDDTRYIDLYREGGVTAIAPTVGGWENARRTLDRIAVWHRLLRERDDEVVQILGVRRKRLV